MYYLKTNKRSFIFYKYFFKVRNSLLDENLNSLNYSENSSYFIILLHNTLYILVFLFFNRFQ